jgi:hypothetical protein
MSVFIGVFGLAALAGIVFGLYELVINIDMKQYALWGSIGLVVSFISWNIGYAFHRHVDMAGGVFECPCGYKGKHPFQEIYHKHKCLSYVLNGKK